MTEQISQNNPTGASKIEVHLQSQDGLLAFKPYLDELGYLIAEYTQVEARFAADLEKLDLFVLLREGKAERLMEAGSLWREALNLQRQLEGLSASKFSTELAYFYMQGKFDLIEEHKRQMARDMAYGRAEETKDNQVQFRASNRLLAELRKVHNRVEKALSDAKAKEAA